MITITPSINLGLDKSDNTSCFDGQVILYQDEYDVYSSDCSKFIYNYKARSGNVLVNVFMSSSSGQYTTEMIGFAH